MIRRIVLLAVTATGFFLAAFCRGVDDAVHIPIIECRVELPPDFSPDAPSVILVYSNTSRSNAIRVNTLETDLDRRTLVPQVRFDGQRPDYRDPVLEERDTLPESGVFVEPEDEFRVSCSISNRFVIPRVWKEMAVTPVHSLQLDLRQFTFSREGELVGVKTVKRIDIERIRKDILRVPRIRKGLLEDTLRVPRPPAGAESGGTTTAVTPAAGSAGPAEAKQAGRANDGSTNEAVKDAAVQPIQTPQGGLPWGILAAGAVVAVALLGVLVRAAVRRNTQPRKANK